MKNERIFLFIVIAIGIISATFCSAVTTGPTLGTVTLNPEHPTKLSTITFDVNVNGDDIKTVKLFVLECNATTGICQNGYDNKTMTHVEGTLYRTDITLDYSPASYITYKVYVESNTGVLTTLPDSHGVKLNLSAGQSNGDNGNEEKSPGFEIVVFIAAVIGSIIVVGRKRFR